VRGRLSGPLGTVIGRRPETLNRDSRRRLADAPGILRLAGLARNSLSRLREGAGMYEIFVNDERQPTANDAKTWGNLLRAVDASCAARGQVVTVVRFDGVEQPAFRDAVLDPYDLGALATIEIEAVRPTDLLLSTIDQAVRAVDTLQQAAERIGAGFRGFDISKANEELADLAGSLGSVVTIASTVSQAIQVNLAELPCDGGNASAMVDELLAHADALITAQELGDWITVADIVEYDVAPCLRRWPAVFEALRESVPGATAAPAA
jgi:hypothetical protein